jgi:hypothetical protein
MSALCPPLGPLREGAGKEALPVLISVTCSCHRHRTKKDVLFLPPNLSRQVSTHCSTLRSTRARPWASKTYRGMESKIASLTLVFGGGLGGHSVAQRRKNKIIYRAHTQNIPQKRRNHKS